MRSSEPDLPLVGFLLTADVNLGIARWLRGRGHKTQTVTAAGDELNSAKELLQHASAQDQAILTHDEQLFDSQPVPEEMQNTCVLVIPQPPFDDISRIAEAVHLFVESGRAKQGTRHRLGLSAGWTELG